MPRKYMHHLKMLSMYIFSSLIVLILYNELSKYWSAIGGGSSQQYKFEIPFAMILLLILYFPSAKNKIIKYLFPAIPVFILYIIFDVFYSFLARSPRMSDLQNFHTLFDFSYGMVAISVFLVLLLILSIYLLVQHAYTNAYNNNSKVSLLLRVLFLISLIYILGTSEFTKWHKEIFEYISWSQKKTIEKNGRFSSFIFYGNQEKENWQVLEQYASSDVDIHQTLYPNPIKEKRNIHVVVLESFIDPRLLKNPQLSKDPLSQDLKPFLNSNSGGFTQVISPAYGGGTAQVEFELLTGIKALSKVSSIEFNVMKGNAISSIVDRLEQYDYRSIATIATSPRFYNSKDAYASLGFDKTIFLTELESGFNSNDDDKRIFDGDIFKYNVKKVKELLSSSKQPIFNYVLGMYGHFPYDRNLEKRPDVILSTNSDKRIQRIANQFYYRTKAIAEYINALMLLDPHSIIYITSDHLPPLLDNNIQYKLSKETNISLLLKDGENMDIPKKNHYEIPWLIWDILKGENVSRNINKEEMENLYFKALSESI